MFTTPPSLRSQYASFPCKASKHKAMTIEQSTTIFAIPPTNRSSNQRRGKTLTFTIHCYLQLIQVASIHTYNILSESNIATFTIHRYLQLIQVCAPSCKLETGNDLDLVIKSLNEL